MTAFGANGEIDRDFEDAVAAGDGFDGELGLDLETAAEEREVLHKRAIEGAIAGKDVGESHAENEAKDKKHETVRPAVEMLEFAARLGVEPRSHHHVGLARRD